MKLLDSLYSITGQIRNDDEHQFVIRLNPEHLIYKAHFPGEPITPGVCILQISEELTELASGLDLELESVKNVKFLQIISPDSVAEVTCTIQKMAIAGESVTSSIIISEGDTVFAKLSIACRISR